MIIKEKIIDEINNLEVSKLSIVYDSIINLKKSERGTQQKAEDIKSVREIHSLLSGITGEWSQDIIKERDDRH